MTRYLSRFFETSPAQLRQTADHIVHYIKTKTGFNLKYVSREALTTTATGGSAFLLTYYSPQVEVHFFFGTKFAEDIKRIDVYPKSTKQFSIYASPGKSLDDYLDRIVAAVKGEKEEAEAPDSDGGAPVKIAPVAPVQVQQTPEQKELQDDLKRWQFANSDLEKTIEDMKDEINYVIQGKTALLLAGKGGIGKCVHSNTNLRIAVSEDFRFFLKENNISFEETE